MDNDSSDITSDAGPIAAPYEIGAELHIRRHVPPRPFGGANDPRPRPVAPVWQDGAAPDQERTFTITGTKTLRRFGVDGGGAHVVTGYADRDKAAVYLAKIYDGETMQPVQTVGGKLVPRYFGAWTFSLATKQPGRRRWVRMLLLQLVHGETMLDKILRATRNGGIQYPLLPPEKFRLCVLKNLFEAEIAIWWDAEVLHSDQEPRNVIIRDDGSVVVLDFNQALVYRFAEQHPKHRPGASRLAPSPIERYWPFAPGGTTLADTEDSENPWASWIPHDWPQNQDLAAEWLLETWKDASPSKYRPLSDYFLNHPAHVQRGRKVLATLEMLGRKPRAVKNE
ncbi:hypothetical protein C8A01DRAFT_44045 [Parachaetomium inaequale]|uniref:Protein kinase domain-containing protein n=1 Tax=Parachaetomium inaequale TaxID=2588326 RepID=A0AAN6PMY5_9PEZI|nr:hypothetical protein C8A01DRAFT_44045 [Parachaetomium inaequale]